MVQKRVVVIGGGFGGLACARSLRRASAEVVLIDRRNFHLFQPLLYQVATGGLSPANIAAPLRCIFRRQRNVRVLMREVVGFDMGKKSVLLDGNEPLDFDYLVLASGSSHHYFGKDEAWSKFAPGLKTIEDATLIRKKVLSAFERAEATKDEALRKKLLTFVIVGGGPTGIELAGSICELAHQTMRNEFRSIDPAKARVILVENSSIILERYHPTLSQKAKEALLSLGAEVWNNTRMTDMGDGYATVLKDGVEERILTDTILWAAGVKASSLGKLLADSLTGTEVDRGGRPITNAFCNVGSREDIFVIGDVANFQDEKGNPLPGVAPVAIQQGEYVGKRISNLLRDKWSDQKFRYWDKGNMATIGRSRAVMESGNMRASGKIAWLAWLFIHILYLARFENRIMVLFQWGWNYITRNRTARLITGSTLHPSRPSETPSKDHHG